MNKRIEKWGNKFKVYPVHRNLTDNGKFHALDTLTEPEYYFTCDDDLVYPPDYVSKTIEAIQKFGCIVTYHGRILEYVGVNYYEHHQCFHCMNTVPQNIIVDVAGTGVTAFDTRYFHPKGLSIDDRQRMSDLIFSLEVAKQNKRIGIISHHAGWLKHTKNKETIHQTESMKGTPIQNSIADEIFKIKYKL